MPDGVQQERSVEVAIATPIPKGLARKLASSQLPCKARRVTARAMTVCITSHVRAGEERRRWRRTWLQAGSVTYAGAAIGIGIRGEARSAEHAESVAPSRPVDIADHAGRGAGSALLSRTPRDHVRCTGIAASECRRHEQAKDVGFLDAVGHHRHGSSWRAGCRFPPVRREPISTTRDQARRTRDVGRDERRRREDRRPPPR